MPTTLTAEVRRVTYENEETSFRVVRVHAVRGLTEPRESLSVVGTFMPVGPGTRIRATGELVTDPRHGEQFRADTVVALVPDTLKGIEKYLGSGVVPGLGPGMAKRIVAAFGTETLEILDSQPERLAEVSGIGSRRVEQFREAWCAQRGRSDLRLLLATHGASPTLAGRILKRYGDRAAAVVVRSPFRLALEVHGVGFRTADRIAKSLGIAGDHPERAQAGVIHELESLAEKGHVCCPRSVLVPRTASMLEIGGEHVEAAIDALFASGRIVVESPLVYLFRLHRAEEGLSRGVVRLLGGPDPVLSGLDVAMARFETQVGFKLAPQQREAVTRAAHHRVVVVTGGPGVGKTTIVRAMLHVFERARLRVRLAAPTGRAAKRLAEATGREAVTLHRLLEVDPKSHGFGRNGECPLDLEALIVDEASMIDISLAAALVEALPKTARLVIVGDADQLASVGPGAVLRDLIASGRVPTVRLDEIFRQAKESGIVANAHRIWRGQRPLTSTDPSSEFFVIQRRRSEEAVALIEELVSRRIPRHFGLDPIAEIQVLVPMHRGPVGTQVLNPLLQAKLNPTGTGLPVGGFCFRVGDKVMQTRNDYEREVFNGDVGRIVAVDPEDHKVTVRFDSREVVYQDSAIPALVLAYATSIHKSQGSEYPAVVIPLLASHFVMLNRNLLYTAVTRAKRLCVLVADPRALTLALAETRREERMTALPERLRALS